MQLFKTKAFSRWARVEGLGDDAFAAAVFEIEAGLIDAELGGQVVKKRVALPGRGRRGGTRTLVAFKKLKRPSSSTVLAKRNERISVPWN